MIRRFFLFDLLPAVPDECEAFGVSSFGVNESGTQLVFSSSRDIDVNLAAERCLLEAAEPGQEILFLYENDPAVVIGRFQNPWKECRTGLARRTGTLLRRRISGGGTVVHGHGNLNWSVIAGRRSPRKNENLDRAAAALGRLGFPVRRNERGDMLLDTGGGGRKIAGSAFRQTCRGSLHHATLLVNANLDFLRSLLDVPPRDIRARGVDSVGASVANLSELEPGVTVEAAAEAIAGAWGAENAGPLERRHPGELVSPAALEAARRRGASDEWNWGSTPPFTECFGDGSLMFHVVQGRIASVDSQDRAGGGRGADAGKAADSGAADALIGCPYRGADILERLSDLEGEGGAARADWAHWAARLAARVDGDWGE